MQKGKPRLSRLTAILTQLQSKHLVTAREIAEKHRISIRTVYRDIRTLESSGIPIVTEEGRGYSILKGYSIPPVMFTENEANALITAAQIISKNKDQSLVDMYLSAVEKIQAVLKHQQKNKSQLLSKRLDIRQNKANVKTSSHLIKLQSAITDYQLLHIHYRTLEGVESKRDIEPFAMIHTQDNWILIAYCRLRMDFRYFRLDCIQKLQMLYSSFTPHKLTLADFFEEARKKWADLNS